MDIKLPGLNTGNFHFHLPGGDIRITGKWFNYGIIFIVMILDLNMWKNQIFYEPFVYGQYTDEQHYIYTVADRNFLANATVETLSYAWRWTHVNPLTNKTYGSEDHKMNSRYMGYPLSAKGTAFIPSLLAFAMFGILVKYFSKGGPSSKVAPAVELKDATDSAVHVKGDAGEMLPSPRVTASRQSRTSYKSELTINKTRNLGSFLSLESSRDGLDLSRDNLDSTRDNLNSSRDDLVNSRDDLVSSRDKLHNSRDNLESSRDDLKSSDDSLRIEPQSLNESNTFRPAWYDSSPMLTLPDNRERRRDSSATAKSTKRRQSSSGKPDNETMVKDLEQELSFLNLDEGEKQSKNNISSD